MQNKRIFLIFCVFICVIAGALFWSLMPWIFGETYTLNLSSFKVAKTPFGRYVLATPSIADPMQDPNQIPCKVVYAGLVSSGDSHILSGDFSCTPPNDSPYLKGNKSHYGIDFDLGNLWISSQEERWLLDTQEESNLMAEVCIHKGRANFIALVY